MCPLPICCPTIRFAHLFDRQVFEAAVSSTPLVELLTRRTSKFRTISGPRMMFLDDAMVRAALHTRGMAAFAAGRVPPGYRHMHAFFGVLAVRRGCFVAVRAARGFFLARAEEDCFIMRADPQTYVALCLLLSVHDPLALCVSLSDLSLSLWSLWSSL
jgi:hypothetical protein